MKSLKLSLTLALLGASTLFAGGITTNTNQSTHFQRSVARDATTDIDAVTSNPAGTAFMKPGLHVGLHNQTFFQTRSVDSDLPLYNDGKGKKFEAETFVPTMPSVLLAWVHGNFALSGAFTIAGGGGSANFEDGIPSFESAIAGLPATMTAAGVPTTRYSADIGVEGTSYIFGLTLGASWRFIPELAAYLGARFNYSLNGYEGHLKNVMVNPTHPQLNPDGDMVSAQKFFSQASAAYAQMAAAAGSEAEKAQYETASQTYAGYAQKVADKELDVSQSGFGVTPIVGLAFQKGAWTVAAKYEHNTSIEMENDTKKNEVGLPAYDDGVKDNADMPGLLAFGVRWDAIPVLHLSLGYHHYFDSHADYAGDKEDYLDDSDEFLAGVEWDVTPRWTVGLGGQYTNFGLSDEYLSDLSLSLSSWSLGCGAAFRVTDMVRLSASYFMTIYDDWTEESTLGTVKYTDTYDRTSYGFSVGVDLDI